MISPTPLLWRVWPFSTKNLSIEHNTDVSKIIFKEKKAIGVEIKKDNNSEIYYCNKEVILSSGSINSPKILQLSGIGDEKTLSQNGINIINHLPGVGKNLQDHLEIYIQHKSKIKDTLYNLSTNYFTQAVEGIKWFLFKKGIRSVYFPKPELLIFGFLMFTTFRDLAVSVKFPLT